MKKEQKLCKEWFQNLQNTICKTITAIEKDFGSSSKFKRNKWKRGEFRIIEGKVIEKGEEAGLVCRDNDEIRSFFISFHNNKVAPSVSGVLTNWKDILPLCILSFILQSIGINPQYDKNLLPS